MSDPAKPNRWQYQPRLFRGGLSGRIFITDKWRELPDGRTEVHSKRDVTDEFAAVAREAGWSPPAAEGEDAS